MRCWVQTLALAISLIFSTGLYAKEDKLRVITTFTIIADLAQNVAGDAATVESITKAGAEIHGYSPTPGDIRRALKADLILWNGMNLELWFEKFFKRLRDKPVAILTDGIVPISIDRGPYTGKPNPHAWMSASDALIYIENIRKALTSQDPDNAAVYAKNAAAYGQEIQNTVAPLKAMFADLPENEKWLVSSEGAFSYLARDLGLKELFLWPINADAQGTPQQVKQMIDTVRTEGIKAVFSESTVSSAPAEQVARETGVAYGGVLYVDSLSTAEGPVPTYLDLLRVTTQTVAEALTKYSSNQ